MPEVQQIPVARIKPNPNNPRHVITQWMIDALAASILSVGLKNPIKVTLLPNGDYQLVSGHIRLAAVLKLGWATIPTLVLTLTPEEALTEAILDNLGQQMTWLDLYEAVESLYQINPNLKQKDVAQKLKIDQPIVSRARTLLKSLTKGAPVKKPYKRGKSANL